jgi:hypothetical protein
MPTIIAEFDGKVFVPEQPIDLATGTKVAIPLPAASGKAESRPVRPTDEQRRERERFIEELNRTEPYFPTVEAALGYSRRDLGCDS